MTPCEEWGLALDVSERPELETAEDNEPRLGNVYLNTHGNYQLVVGLRPCTVYYMTYNRKGELLSLGQYGIHVLRDRRVIGRTSMPVLLEVEWFA